MKHQTKHRYTDAVLFECDVPEDVQSSGNAIRYALEKAVKDDVNLRDSDLRGAYLNCADLYGADLTGAYLSGADLGRANLYGAYLGGAYLRAANLTGANLNGANLRGAYLGDGEKLIGDRPVFVTDPIGSRCDYLTAYLTDKGIRLRAGCFFGDMDTFRNKLEAEHGDNDHAAEYRAVLVLIEKHAEIWTPKGEV